MLEGRREIAPNVVVARLDEAEALRVQGSLFDSWEPDYRLEIHGYQIPLAGDYLLDVEEVVRRAFALLCCVVRATPRWPSIVIDHHGGASWRRFDWVHASGGIAPFGSSGVWRIPIERMESWGELLTRFPARESFPRLDIALDYFYDSVTDRKLHPHKAYMSAATAHEVLLGTSEASRYERHSLNVGPPSPDVLRTGPRCNSSSRTGTSSGRSSSTKDDVRPRRR
jgi:hypothetical protein